MGLSKMRSKRQLYSNTDLPQETGKTLNYLTFTPNGARKRKKERPKVSGRKELINLSGNK